MSVYKILAVTHNNNQMEHAHMFVCEENLIHIHNSVLHKHALQAFSPTGHSVEDHFAADNPCILKRYSQTIS